MVTRDVEGSQLGGEAFISSAMLISAKIRLNLELISMQLSATFPFYLKRYEEQRRASVLVNRKMQNSCEECERV